MSAYDQEHYFVMWLPMETIPPSSREVLPLQIAASHHALKRLLDAAQQAGFECLSSEWQGWKARYAFRCSQGHDSTRIASSVIRNAIVCAECTAYARLDRIRQAALVRGGRCLEDRYLGDVSHRFSCAQGHEWKTRPYKVMAEGSWCPHCAHQNHSRRMTRQDGLELLQRRAAERRGVCLSTAYHGMKEYYSFQCAHGHQWKAEGAEVARGAWCRHCVNEEKRLSYRLTDGLQRLHKAANAKGGICLSAKYTGANTHYRFRCRDGHEWEAVGKRILRASWCPYCVNAGKRLGIELMRQIAQERGGACLSELYVNVATKLHWECHRGHRWYARPAPIRKGHWCPDCANLEKIRNRKSNARWKYLMDGSSGMSENC